MELEEALTRVELSDALKAKVKARKESKNTIKQVESSKKSTSKKSMELETSLINESTKK
jgi:hypothetical protein